MPRALAEKLGIARVIVPPDAGVGSAVGFLAAPVAYEMVRSRYMRLDAFDRRGRQRAARGDERGGARAGRAGRAGGAGARAPRSPSCAMSARATRSRSTLPERAADRRRTPCRCARRSSASMPRCSTRSIPNAAIEILSWSVLVSTEATRAGRAGAGAPRSAAADGRSAARSASTAAAAGRTRRCRSIAASSLPPGSAIAGPALDRRGRDLDLISASFDAQIDGAGCIVMDREAA